MTTRDTDASVEAMSSGEQTRRPAAPTTPSEAVDLDLDRKREILAREAVLGRDDWTVLGLKPGATAEAVKLAYFEASRVFHPTGTTEKSGELPRPAGAHLPAAQRGPRGAHRGAPPRSAAAHGRSARTARPGPTGSTSAADRAPRSAGPASPAAYRLEGARRRAGGRGPAAGPERSCEGPPPDRPGQVTGGHAGPARAPAVEAEPSSFGQPRAEGEMQSGNEAARAADAEGGEAYSRASELDPTRADAAYEAARWLLKAGHPLAEARGFAQRAVSLRTDHVPSQLVLAEICLG